ncbi:MAG: hypothetical protein VW175_10075, partial [Alphaproteobacteria bacterium]
KSDLIQILMGVKAIFVAVHFSHIQEHHKPRLAGEIASCRSRMLSVRQAPPITGSGSARHCQDTV